MYQIFIDFPSAYDSIRREKIYEVTNFFILNKFIRLIKATMNDLMYHVKIGQMMNDGFKVGNGLKQGDGYVTRQLPVDVISTVFYKSVQLIEYTDDINIMGRTKIFVSEVYEELQERAKEVGLNITVEETKELVQNMRTRRISEILTLKDHGIEVVRSFKYLGTVINNTNYETEEIKARILTANKACCSLQTLLPCKQIH
jgi:hypothetical protein